MKDEQGMLNDSWAKLGNKRKYDRASGEKDYNVPIAIRAIMALISYYSSIADEENVAILETKLNIFIDSLDTNQLRGGLDVSNINEKYLSTESLQPICTEDGKIILV